MTNKINRKRSIVLSLITLIACFLPVLSFSINIEKTSEASEPNQEYYLATILAIEAGYKKEMEKATDEDAIEALERKYEKLSVLIDKINQKETIQIAENSSVLLFNLLYPKGSLAQFRSIVTDIVTLTDLWEKIMDLKHSDFLGGLSSAEQETLDTYEKQYIEIEEKLNAADFSAVTYENVKKALVVTNFSELENASEALTGNFYFFLLVVWFLGTLVPFIVLILFLRLIFAFAEQNEDRKNAKIKHLELTIYKWFTVVLSEAIIFKWIHVSAIGWGALVVIVAAFVLNILQNRKTLNEEEKKHMNITILGSAILLLGYALFSIGSFGLGLFEAVSMSADVYSGISVITAFIISIFGSCAFFPLVASVTALDRATCEYRYNSFAISHCAKYMAALSIATIVSLIFATTKMHFSLIIALLLLLTGTVLACSVRYVLQNLYTKHAPNVRARFEEEEAVLTVFMKNKKLMDISEAREMRAQRKPVSETIKPENQ